MPLTTETQPISAERLTYHSTIAFTTAESRLRSSIQQSPVSPWFKFQEEEEEQQQQKRTSPPSSKDSFTAWVTSCVGPHGFMLFNEYNHGTWLPFFAPPTSHVTVDGRSKDLKCVRFILGNPLIAITMLRHDLDAGLSVPVELYLVEEPEGGVRIVWFKPSGLVAGYEGAQREVVDAAEVLNVKLEALIRWVLREDEEPLPQKS